MINTLDKDLSKCTQISCGIKFWNELDLFFFFGSRNYGKKSIYFFILIRFINQKHWNVSVNI